MPRGGMRECHVEAYLVGRAAGAQLGRDLAVVHHGDAELIRIVEVALCGGGEDRH